jgi:hypothetical protein
MYVMPDGVAGAVRRLWRRLRSRRVSQTLGDSAVSSEARPSTPPGHRRTT